MSIAGLVTGILTLGPVALVLGIIGLTRTKPTREPRLTGRGLAVAAIVLGVLTTIGWIVAAIMLLGGGNSTSHAGLPLISKQDPALEALWDQCAADDMAACDTLFMTAPQESDYEAFGKSCGDRIQNPADFCADIDFSQPITSEGQSGSQSGSQSQ